jgi:hypothetical protein
MTIFLVYDSLGGAPMTRVLIREAFRTDLTVVNKRINDTLKSLERNRSRYYGRPRRRVMWWHLGPYTRESLIRGDDVNIIVTFETH